MSQAKKRDLSLDFLRGFAILLMIFTHVVAILYVGGYPLFDFIGRLGGAICFTIFLFVFGAVFGIKLSKNKINPKVELRRSLKFLIGYFFIALWVFVFFYRGLAQSTGQILSDIWGIFTFTWLPEYVEFISAFVFNIWLIVLLRKQLRIVLNRPVLVIVSAIAVYLTGWLLYAQDLGSEYLNVLKGQLVGHEEIHFFGIISYLPVLVLGLWWGYQVVSVQKNVLKYGLIGSIITFGLYHGLQVVTDVGFSRWPPTPLFLIYGLLYTFAILTVFRYIQKVSLLVRPIIFVGQAAFEYFTYHVLIIMFMYYVLNGNRQAEGTSLLLFILLMMVMTVLVYLKKKVNSTFRTTF